MDRFFICGVEVTEETFCNINSTGYETENNTQGGVDFKIETYDLEL
jgi:hypothetical protein